MKPVRFCGDALKRLREFPQNARHDAGYQLEKIQLGQQPDDFKSVPSIGPGVEEIRIRDGGGAWRVIYTARLQDAVYVLHCFEKKSSSTAARDIDLARRRFRAIKGAADEHH